MNQPARQGAVKSADLQKKLKRGIIVFGVVMVIEIVEFVIGVRMTKDNWLVLAPFAFVGAWPIVQYFMHIGHIRHPHTEE
ncbi:MAG: hypothetical protein Q7T26_09920 [Dehalococcoidia bacterium]|nr:hypothetical protein [Dehalococcoidia bacterium]